MTPADLTSLIGWWRPEGLASIANDATVDPWPDDSGLGNDLDLVSANPNFKRANLLNGFAGVQLGFDGGGFFAASKMQATFTTQGDNSASEIMMVLKVLTDPGVGGDTGAVIGEADPGFLGSSYTYSDGGIYQGFCSNVRHTCGDPSQSLTTYHILRIRSTDGEFTLEIDGSVVYTTATNTFYDAGGFTLGYDARFAGKWCYIIEGITTNNLLSSGEVVGMYEYFNTKYFGNTFSTQAAGAHETGATWVGGVAPVSADNATLNILHDVTLNSDFDCVGATISGKYTVKQGNTLKTTANILFANSTAELVIGEITGGAGLDLDSDTLNITVSGAGKLVIRGTEANRSLIRSVGTEVGYIDAVKCDLQYYRLENIGDADIRSLNDLPAGFNHILQHGIFVNSGFPTLASQGATDGYSITHNKFYSVLGLDVFGQLTCLYIPASFNPDVGVVRELKNNVFIRSITVDKKDIIDQDNLYLGTGAIGNSNFGAFSGLPADFKRPIIRHCGDGVFADGLHLGNINGDSTSWIDGGIMLHDSMTIDWETGQYTDATEQNNFNPHWLGGLDNVDTVLKTRYMIFIDLGSHGGGDIFLHHNSGNWLTEYIISIYDDSPEGDGGPSVLHTVAATAGVSTPRHIAKHCTHQAGSTGAQVAMMAGGELIEGYEDQIETENNICWSLVDLSASYGGGIVAGWFGTGALAVDIALGSKNHTNHKINLNLVESNDPGTQAQPGGPGYDCIVTGILCGNNDTVGGALVDEFIDHTVTLNKWHESLLPSWTGWPGSTLPMRVQRNGDAFYRLSLVNEPSHADYNSGFVRESLVGHVIHGFTPLNSAVIGTASDGTTRGAVQLTETSISVSHTGAIFNSLAGSALPGNASTMTLSHTGAIFSALAGSSLSGQDATVVLTHSGALFNASSEITPPDFTSGISVSHSGANFNSIATFSASLDFISTLDVSHSGPTFTATVAAFAALITDNFCAEFVFGHVCADIEFVQC